MVLDLLPINEGVEAGETEPLLAGEALLSAGFAASLAFKIVGEVSFIVPS